MKLKMIKSFMDINSEIRKLDNFLNFQVALEFREKFIESISSEVINFLNDLEGFINKEFIGEVYDEVLVSAYSVYEQRKYIVKSFGISIQEMMLMKKLSLIPYKSRYDILKNNIIEEVVKKVNAKTLKEKNEFLALISTEVIKLLQHKEGFKSKEVIGKAYDIVLNSRFPNGVDRKKYIKLCGIVLEENLDYEKVSQEFIQKRYNELKNKVIKIVDNEVNAEIYRLKTEERKQKVRDFTEDVKENLVNTLQKIDKSAEEKLGINLEEKRSNLKTILSDEETIDLIGKGIGKLISMKRKK